ncbi:MAG TPA: WhiB family transcriptional regulator [Mycobacterium sp.]
MTAATKPRATPLPGIPVAAVDRWQRLAEALHATDAPCTGSNRDWWTSDDNDERTAAAFHCASCPVLGLCAAYADDARESHHVWAGVDRGKRTKPPRRSTDNARRMGWTA